MNELIMRILVIFPLKSKNIKQAIKLLLENVKINKSKNTEYIIIFNNDITNELVFLKCKTMILNKRNNPVVFADASARRVYLPKIVGSKRICSITDNNVTYGKYDKNFQIDSDDHEKWIKIGITTINIILINSRNILCSAP